MDMLESIEARSDQVNADDLLGGPITYTVREVVAGRAEQPFDFLLVETARAYRPSKTMRRVIVAAWGPDKAAYAGRRLTLYREPSIRFGGQVVGGIRISHMSHVDGPVETMAQTSRGKREKFVIRPIPVLPDPTPLQLAAQVVTALAPATTVGEVREWGNRAHAHGLLDLSPEGASGTVRELIEARLAEMSPDV